MDVFKDFNELGLAYFPPVQLMIYLGILFLYWACSGFDIETFIEKGVQLLFLWVAVACFMGVSTDVSWTYYLLLIGSLLLALTVYIGVNHMLEKLGRRYRGDFGLALMGYVFVPVNLLVVSMVLKLVWQWLS